MKYEVTAMRLRKAMSDCDISQQELADKSGIGKSSVSHYVNGTHAPGNIKAYAMAKVLHVDPAWLMGFDVPMQESSSLSEPSLRSDELNLLSDYNLLDSEDRGDVRGYIKGLLRQDKYKEKESGTA